MRYILPLVLVVCLVSLCEAHGRSNFRRNDFNDGFRQGFRAAQQRQQFNNGHRFQQFNGHNQFRSRGLEIRAPFFRFGF